MVSFPQEVQCIGVTSRETRGVYSKGTFFEFVLGVQGKGSGGRGHREMNKAQSACCLAGALATRFCCVLVAGSKLSTAVGHEVNVCVADTTHRSEP